MRRVPASELHVQLPLLAIRDRRLGVLELRVLAALGFLTKMRTTEPPIRTRIAEPVGLVEKGCEDADRVASAELRITRSTNRLSDLGWVRKEGASGRGQAASYSIKRAITYLTNRHEPLRASPTRNAPPHPGGNGCDGRCGVPHPRPLRAVWPRPRGFDCACSDQGRPPRRP